MIVGEYTDNKTTNGRSKQAMINKPTRAVLNVLFASFHSSLTILIVRYLLTALLNLCVNRLAYWINEFVRGISPYEATPSLLIRNGVYQPSTSAFTAIQVMLATTFIGNLLRPSSN